MDPVNEVEPKGMLNKKVIVTGGTYGIGSAVVAALVGEGCTIASMARGSELGEKEAAAQTKKGPGKVNFYRCDVSRRADVHSAFTAAAADMGGLDALVHVAGVEGGHSPETETEEEWDRIFDVNAKGTFLTNQEAFHFLKDKGGRIINFGSGAGVVGVTHCAAYSASKGAVSTWTRTCAQAWGQYRIAVNQVMPLMWTSMYDGFRAKLTPEELTEHDAMIARSVHLGRAFGKAEHDLAPVIIFLLSEGARFITGQTIPVDGGLLMVR
jgi:NAD(P)-dependent dehydrogenase (short-subunit alcohol dehydrogenase family)